MTRAVVFAYHNVGVRCLKVLLAQGIDVPLVVTHADDPGEAQWFGSVAATARDYGIATIAPDDPNAADVVAHVAAQAPDFLFSFYYRRMLGAALLALPPRGALNMHGSLLPKFRGRAPVNWAVLAGERETGATLHYMTVKPDDGDIVAQTAVPILPDDTAQRGLRQGDRRGRNDARPRAARAGGRQRAAHAAGSRAAAAIRRPAPRRRGHRLEPRRRRRSTTSSAPSRRRYPGAFTAVNGVAARILRTRVADAAAPRALQPVLESDRKRVDRAVRRRRRA